MTSVSLEEQSSSSSGSVSSTAKKNKNTAMSIDASAAKGRKTDHEEVQPKGTGVLTRSPEEPLISKIDPDPVTSPTSLVLSSTPGSPGGAGVPTGPPDTAAQGPLPPVQTVSEYEWTCSFGQGEPDCIKTIKLHLEKLLTVEKQYLIENPILRAESEKILRRLTKLIGVESVETAGMAPHMRSHCGLTTLVFLLPIMMCTVNPVLKAKFSQQLKVMQDSIKTIMQRERVVLLSAMAVDQLGPQGDEDIRKNAMKNLVCRRLELVQEVASHAPVRGMALSAIMGLSENDRSELLSAGALTAHSLTCQPDELLEARSHKRHTPKAMMAAVTIVLKDLQDMGMENAESKTLYRQHYLLQAVQNAISLDNKLLPANLEKLHQELQAVTNGPSADVMLFDAISQHLARLQESNPEELRAAAVKFLRDRLVEPVRHNSHTLGKLAVAVVTEKIGEGRVSHDNDMTIRAPKTIDSWMDCLNADEGSEATLYYSVGAPFGKCAGYLTESVLHYATTPVMIAAHPYLAAVTGLYGIPKYLAPMLAEHIFEKAGVLPFLMELFGFKDFYNKVQRPIY